MQKEPEDLGQAILDLFNRRDCAMTALELAALIHCEGPDDDGEWPVTPSQLADVRQTLKAFTESKVIFPLYRTYHGVKRGTEPIALRYANAIAQSHGEHVLLRNQVLHALWRSRQGVR